MTAPTRIQLSRRKGWRMPPNTVKVDRSTEWGNPFCVGVEPHRKLVEQWGWKFKHPERLACNDSAEAVRLFKQTLARDFASLYAIRKELAGKNLACWCTLDQPCHADVLLDLANR